MKFSRRLNKSVRFASPVLLALLLSIVLLPGAALAQPPGPIDIDDGNSQQTPPPPSNTPAPPATPPATPPPAPPATATPNPPGNPPSTPVPAPTAAPPPGATPHASAPFTPPADCIVAHAATPAQLCPISGGLQYYFIGSGSSQPGPWIQPLSELATLHAGVVSLYSGTNPLNRQVSADPLHACRPEDSGQHLLPR